MVQDYFMLALKGTIILGLLIAAVVIVELCTFIYVWNKELQSEVIPNFCQNALGVVVEWSIVSRIQKVLI